MRHSIPAIIAVLALDLGRHPRPAQAPYPARARQRRLHQAGRLCTRASPQEGRPPRESGIATRHPGRTVQEGEQPRGP